MDNVTSDPCATPDNPNLENSPGWSLAQARDVAPSTSMGCSTSVYRTVTSTQDIALQHAQRGAPHGHVVLADQQTQGRGRRGQLWQSPDTCDIYASVIVRKRLAAEHKPLLSLLAGLAVSEAIEHMLQDDSPSRVQIKWPNDVLIDQRKCAGILSENTGPKPMDPVVVGMGVNVGRRDFPGELAYPATSLMLARQSQGGVASPHADPPPGCRDSQPSAYQSPAYQPPACELRAQLWSTLRARLDHHIDAFTQYGFHGLRQPINDRLAWKQQPVQWCDDRGEQQGQLQEVDGQGRLLVSVPSGPGAIEKRAIRHGVVRPVGR